MLFGIYKKIGIFAEPHTHSGLFLVLFTSRTTSQVVRLFLLYQKLCIDLRMEGYIMPAGRPITPLDLPEGWQDVILELYGEGGSDAEVKGTICRMRGRFSNDLWDRWLNDEPEFSETIKMGRMLSEQWWHQQGRKNLKVQAFNYTGWYMQMKNRFGWADKQETSTKTESTITWKEERTYQQKDEAND